MTTGLLVIIVLAIICMGIWVKIEVGNSINRFNYIACYMKEEFIKNHPPKFKHMDKVRCGDKRIALYGRSESDKLPIYYLYDKIDMLDNNFTYAGLILSSKVELFQTGCKRIYKIAALKPNGEYDFTYPGEMLEEELELY